MKKLALILLLLAASLQARADIVIVQSIESPLGTHNVTVTIKGDKFRTDLADQMTSITNLANGDTITLIHAKKAYLKMTGEEMHTMIVGKMSAALQGQAPPTAADAPKITDTGKTEKIGDYTAEIYSAETKLMKFTYWVTKDYPDYAAVNAQMQKFNASKAALQEKTGTQNYLVPDTTKLDGVVLKTEMIDTKGQTSKMTLISAKVQPVDDSTFNMPADYVDARPSLPQSAAAPAAPAPATK